MNTQTKQAGAPGAYLFRGDDDFRKRRELDKLLSSLVSDEFADFDLEQLQGDSSTADRIMAGLNVPPLSSPQRVVLVRYANKMPEDEQKKLASQLSKTPATGCLILISPAAEKSNGKPRKGSEVIGELSRAVRKIGKVVTVGGERANVKAGQARQFVNSLFTEAGKKIEPAALAVFLQRVGSDFSVAGSEAHKLIDYSGESGCISLADVDAVTSETAEEKIFKLVDATAAGDRASALRLLDELFDAGDNPDADAPRALAVIARQFRLLWQVRQLSEAGIRTLKEQAVSEEIKADLPAGSNVLDVVKTQPWQEDRLTKQARRFARGQLVRCFNAIASADLKLKGIEGNMEDPRAVMEMLVLELAGTRQK